MDHLAWRSLVAAKCVDMLVVALVRGEMTRPLVWDVVRRPVREYFSTGVMLPRFLAKPPFVRNLALG